MNNNLTPTPHIKANAGDFAKTVLMPGDPLRAKFVAENFLENAVLVNNVRGVHGYTGTYKGTKVSVMAPEPVGVIVYSILMYGIGVAAIPFPSSLTSSTSAF